MMRTATKYYAVDPYQVAKVLFDNMPEPILDTGLISDDILQVYKQGDKQLVFSYRKPQLTGIWLEDEKDALIVPMPGLILARSVNHYAIVAVKRRPQPGSELFVAPLPNTGTSGICWGTVSKPNPEQTKINMKDDWAAFFGSQFNSHSVSNKCKSSPDDVREFLKRLHSEKAKRFPKDEYLSIHLKYSQWVERITEK